MLCIHTKNMFLHYPVKPPTFVFVLLVFINILITAAESSTTKSLPLQPSGLQGKDKPTDSTDTDHQNANFRKKNLTHPEFLPAVLQKKVKRSKVPRAKLKEKLTTTQSLASNGSQTKGTPSTLLIPAWSWNEFDRGLQPHPLLRNKMQWGPQFLYDKRFGENTTTSSTTEAVPVVILPLNVECNPSDDRHQCEKKPGVDCLEHAEGLHVAIYQCQCNYFYTEVAVQNPGPNGSNVTCKLNVFAPCLVGGTEVPCGDNMRCTSDTLRITRDKFCRCLPGYEPAVNVLGIPAFCLKGNNTQSNLSADDVDAEDSMVDSANQLLPVIIYSIFLLSAKMCFPF